MAKVCWILGTSDAKWPNSDNWIALPVGVSVPQFYFDAVNYVVEMGFAMHSFGYSTDNDFPGWKFRFRVANFYGEDHMKHNLEHFKFFQYALYETVYLSYYVKRNYIKQKVHLFP
jgi:hypothetical protein